MPSNIVAIVGRPNVGKSTLFNRILGVREAIVHDSPGVTRDRKYAEAEWTGKQFIIIDTGGFVPDSKDVFERAIREQAQIAIEEADVVVFVVDAMAGVAPLDKELADILRKSDKPVYLIANKIDSAQREIHAHEFHELGLGEPIQISALGGRQIGDFLDTVTSTFEQHKESEQVESPLRLAVIGKPNVGKSSLVNALLGVNRQVVTDIPGTTRDPIDSLLKYKNEEVILIDTAGLKKQRRVSESIEFYSALRTLKSIDRSDVAVILLDAQRGIDHQDLHIIESALERNRAAVIAVNKWDLVEKDTNTSKKFETFINAKLGLYDYLPVAFVSALTRQRIFKLIDLAQEVHREQSKRVGTSELNDTMLPVIENNPPKSSSPKEIKIKFITQVKTRPPVFAMFCNEPKLVQESYKRFLMHQLRDHFGFRGVPLRLTFKRK
ncbi:MAG: ribosome biogenesis GTPase Der [Ignavibacteriales bacterium]|nr:ribosome biogenesis GTPase Der [Ignavibacteriales bacterium]